MIESFVTAFIIYFVVIDPIGNAPIFLAVTQHQDKARKTRTAIEGTAVATAIMLFFALCGAWILQYLAISEAAFKIAGGVILFTVALEMLSDRRQARKQRASSPASGTTDNDQTGTTATKPAEDDDLSSDNVALFPLAIPLLAGPAAIMSVMVVSADMAGSLGSSLVGYGALLAVMAVTGVILIVTVSIERIIDPRATAVFSRITAIILAALSVQYIIDGVNLVGWVG